MVRLRIANKRQMRLFWCSLNYCYSGICVAYSSLKSIRSDCRKTLATAGLRRFRTMSSCRSFKIWRQSKSGEHTTKAVSGTWSTSSWKRPRLAGRKGRLQLTGWRNARVPKPMLGTTVKSAHQGSSTSLPTADRTRLAYLAIVTDMPIFVTPRLVSYCHLFALLLDLYFSYPFFFLLFRRVGVLFSCLLGPTFIQEAP